MSSLKEDWAYHKESQQIRYGYYCGKMKVKGEEPIPFHKWQEIDNKKEYIIGVDLAKDTTMSFKQEYDCEWVGEESILENAKFSEQDLKDMGLNK